jgi:hypothetical protein
VAGVVAAEVSNHDVMLLCQQVNDFSFGLVTPLKPDYRSCTHNEVRLSK